MGSQNFKDKVTAGTIIGKVEVTGNVIVNPPVTAPETEASALTAVSSLPTTLEGVAGAVGTRAEGWFELARIFRILARILRILIPLAVGSLLVVGFANDRSRNAVFGQNVERRFDQRDWTGSVRPEQEYGMQGLAIAPSTWIATKDVEPRELSNFQLRFAVWTGQYGGENKSSSTDSEMKAEWVLRAQLTPSSSQPRQLSDIPGLHFQLIYKEKVGRFYIRVSRVNKNGKVENLGPETSSEHRIFQFRPLIPEQYLRIYVTVMRNRISHCVEVHSANPKDPTDGLGVSWWDTQREFVDNSSQFNSGGLAFGSPDDKEIFIGDIARSSAPSRELVRCFLSGRFCFKPEAHRPCT